MNIVRQEALGPDPDMSGSRILDPINRIGTIGSSN